MLRERVITAIVLLVAFALLLVFASVDVFALALILIVAAAGWEWSRLCGVRDENLQTAYAIVVGLLALFTLYSPLADQGVKWLLLIGFLFWGSALLQFYLNPVMQPLSQPSVSLLLTGIPLLVIAAVSLQALRTHAPYASNGLLLYSLAVIWVMDIGAYFVGRQFGKRKLALKISPGKSWEGVYGGVAAAALLFLLSLALFDWPQGSAWKLFLATVFSAAASVIGDLYESRIKRAIGMKDSSQMLPGHGGVLDRLDGVLAAVPVFAFFWFWM